MAKRGKSVKSQDTVGSVEKPVCCKKRVEKINEACTDAKEKTATKQADWKANKCGMLKIKPAFGNKTPETRKKDLEDLKEKIKDLNADTIKEQLGKEMEEMLSIGVGDVAWQGLKKVAKRFIPIYGWISIPGDIAEAKEFFKLVDIYEKKFRELEERLPQYPKKLKELAEAINSGDTAKASKELVDVQSDYALVNKCMRARKCLLVPFSDTASCKSPSSAKDCSKGKAKPTRAEKKQRGCCQGQTGHHLMPDAYFTKKSKRGVPDKGICKGYSQCDAPTVCVEGAGHSHGSHGKLHDATDKAAAKAAKKNPTFGYKQARDACIEAHKETFPLSFCKEDCIKEQLDAYYDCACDDNRSIFGDDKLNAMTSVGVEEKEWHSKPLNGTNKNGTQRW